jgi:hypothetical protein
MPPMHNHPQIVTAIFTYQYAIWSGFTVGPQVVLKSIVQYMISIHSVKFKFHHFDKLAGINEVALRSVFSVTFMPICMLVISMLVSDK